jgi:hypothetical protein
MALANYLPAFSKSCAAANSNRLLENSFTLEKLKAKIFGNQNNANDCPCCPYKNEYIIE